MFDIGWQELMLIGVVALIVVGPKDLPKAMRTGARMLQKARGMSREFQNGLAEMAREAELDDIRSKVERATRFDLGDELRKVADPHGKLSADFDPTEFNRQLKASVEAGPPKGPATPLPPAGPVAMATEPTATDAASNEAGAPATATTQAETAPAARGKVVE